MLLKPPFLQHAEAVERLLSFVTGEGLELLAPRWVASIQQLERRLLPLHSGPEIAGLGLGRGEGGEAARLFPLG